VKRFPGPRDLAALMAGCGLRDIRWILTAGGIIAIHVGTVPEARG
jgi:demethylmenaquinone methyltransferase/2-methoxy-6-polyprenyl-1,4-benzoquinol methylase